MTRISRVKARKILSEVPWEKAFHFYMDVDEYTGRSASSLSEFCDALENLDAKSIEFHINRGDFENWVRFLTDHKLAGEIAKLREKKLMGEVLRGELHGLIRKRINELKAVSQG